MRLFWKRCLLFAGFALAALACGDDSSDPAVIKVSELLGPGKLSILDNGDGSVTLFWDVANAEDDFEGYNIYGAKMDASELEQFGATQGRSLQLLSQTGDPLDSAKGLLQALDFADTNEKALPGAPTKLTEEQDEEDKPKFSFLPIHQQDAEQKPLLPTCQPAKSSDASNAAIECQLVQSEDSKKDESEVSAFGTNFYKINSLTPGQSYCFIIFAVQDGGEEISQSSSTVECVIPKIETTWSQINLGSTGDQQAYDLAGFADACSAEDATCPSPDDYRKIRTGDTGGISATETPDSEDYEIHIEAYGSSNDAYIVGGKHVAIKDVGTFTSLASVPEDITTVSFPSNYSSDESDTSKNTLVSGNYTRPFASVLLKNNHVYVIAVGNQDADSPTTFTYHFLHVAASGTTISKTEDFTVTLRVNKVAGVL